MNILEYAGDVTVQVGIMIILILAGFAATKAGWINEKGAPQFINLLFYIVTPAVIVNAFLSVEFTASRAVSLIIMAGCAALIHLIGLVVSALAFRKEKRFLKPVLSTSVIFSNCGFMSLPLAAALLGSEGVFFVSIYVVMHNIIIWTLGVSLYEPSQMSVKKALINPGTIGVVIGLPLFLLKIALPEILAKPIEHLASLNTPLAMIIIGFYLAGTALKIQKGDGKLVFCSLLRLVAVPAIGLLVLWVLPIPNEVFLACMLPASAPVASNVTMFAAKFNSDVDASSRLVSVSTVLSVITIPVFMSLAQLALTV